MGTEYSFIYERALSKMREYSFIDLYDGEIFDALSPFRKSAEADFSRICIVDLNDCCCNGYNNDLSNEEIEILALGVVVYWMSAYVADADKLRNAIGTKDFSLFSPANLLSTIESVRESIDLDYRSKMNVYSYIHGNVFRDGKGW